MDSEFKNDMFVVYLKNSNKNGELETIFHKPIHLNRRMECSLKEIVLPNEIYPSNNDNSSNKSKITSTKTYRLTLYIYYVQISYKLEWKYNVVPSANHKQHVDEAIFYDSELYSITANSFDKLNQKLNKIVDESNEFIKQKLVNNFKNENLSVLNPNNLEEFYPLQFKYDDKSNRYININGKFDIKVEKNINSEKLTQTAAYFYLIPDQNLHKLLGFAEEMYPHFDFKDNNISFNSPDKFIAKFPPKIIKTVDLFYVYCDIIKESFVENNKLNILRIFAKDNASNENIVTYYFNKSLYIPLRVDEIYSIKVSIRNKFAEILNFEKGEIQATLLFRPIEYI